MAYNLFSPQKSHVREVLTIRSANFNGFIGKNSQDYSVLFFVDLWQAVKNKGYYFNE
jgi:hypothetical protein